MRLLPVLAALAASMALTACTLNTAPATVNEDAEGKGWFLKLKVANTGDLEELMSAEGKTALKKEIAERASKAFRFKVNDVLLAEFVVQ